LIKASSYAARINPWKSWEWIRSCSLLDCSCDKREKQTKKKQKHADIPVIKIVRGIVVICHPGVIGPWKNLEICFNGSEEA